MTIKALIFDFDGLIMETEMPCYQSWMEIYQEHDLELPLELWMSFVGGTGASDYEPTRHLAGILGSAFDPEVTQLKQDKRFMALLKNEPAMPGVVSYLEDAKGMGLKLAIASSSSAEWVHRHLNQLGLQDYFQAIVTAEHVAKTKPDPALFLTALARLDVEAREAVVLEDSLNGVRGAKRAGIFVVAVPNSLTAHTPAAQEADFALGSLAEMPLAELLCKVEGSSF